VICERVVVVVSKFRFYLLKNGKEESDAVMMVQLLLFGTLLKLLTWGYCVLQ
jgi:hypothetical protein